MAKSHDVLAYLYPQGGWTMTGFEYEGIEFGECDPITKAEFEQAFVDYDAWKAGQDLAKAQAKATAQAKLAALGLTVADLEALGL